MSSKKIVDLKSAHFVLVAQAGLPVASMEEMKMEDICSSMGREFKLIVDAFDLPDGLKGTTNYHTILGSISLIVYHIISYYIISYHIISYHTTSYHHVSHREY